MKIHWAAWVPVVATSVTWFGQKSANAQEVKVDLQPCIITKAAIVSAFNSDVRRWQPHGVRTVLQRMYENDKSNSELSRRVNLEHCLVVASLCLSLWLLCISSQMSHAYMEARVWT